MAEMEAEIIDVMDIVKMSMTESYPEMMVHSNWCPVDSTPFLHIWSRVSKPTPSQGLRFLPCFHIIVTASSVGDDQETTSRVDLTYSLFTFHGKLLKSHVVCSSELEENEQLSEMLENLSTGSIQLCRGIKHVLPLKHNQSDVLLECLADKVVARSRNCLFHVNAMAPEITGEQNIQCSECKDFDSSLLSRIKTEHEVIEDVDDDKKAFVFSNKDQLLASIKHTKPEFIEQEVKPEAISFTALKKEHHGFDSDNKFKPLSLNKSITINKTTAASVSQKLARNKYRMPEPEVTISLCDNDVSYYSDNDDINYQNDDDYRGSSSESDDSDDEDYMPSAKKQKTTSDAAKQKRPQIQSNGGSVSITRVPKPKKKAPSSHHQNNGNSKDGDTAIYKCKVCLIAYRNDWQMERCIEAHRKMIDLDVPAVCPACNESIASKLELTDHFAQKHATEGVTCCCECMDIVQTTMLTRHVMVEHNHRHSNAHQEKVGGPKGSSKTMKPKPPKPVKIRPPDWKPKVRVRQEVPPCKVCLKVHKRPSVLQACMERHKEVMALDENIVCPLCAAQVARIDVTAHFQSEHQETGQTCCCQCLSLVRNDKGMLRAHIIQNHHSATESHLCADCGKAYHNIHNLERHINEVHLKVITHYCEHCGKQFAHKRAYMMHTYTHKEQNLKCVHCDKVFTRRMQLMKHLRMHTKYKPFKCVHCNYTSERKGNVCLHVKKVHHKKWSNDDVMIDQEQFEEMKRLAIIDADRIVANAKDP